MNLAQTGLPRSALEPRSRRPNTSRAKLTEEVKHDALGVRAALGAPGWTTGRSACTTRCTAPQDLPAGTAVKKLTSNGTFKLAGVTYMVGGQYGFQHVLVLVDDDTITVANADGVVLIEHTRRATGTSYIGIGRPR